jgi:outer membrane cobalamin receptor
MKTRFTNIFFFTLLCCLAQNSLFAQQTSDSLNYERYKFALEELQQDSTDNLITLATQTTLRLRDAPSVVSVITRADIEAMGARDLLDVLRHIQGFDLGVDVNGVVGMGLRGNWAHEGKILLMVDGLEMNELMYGTTQLGNHFPLLLLSELRLFVVQVRLFMEVLLNMELLILLHEAVKI